MNDSIEASTEATTITYLEGFTPTVPAISHRHSYDEATALPPSQDCAVESTEVILNTARAISVCDAIWPSSRVAVAESLLDELARILARMTLDMHRGDLPSPGA